LTYIASTLQKKLLKKFQNDYEAKKLRGTSVNTILKSVKQGDFVEAAKDMVEFFAAADPSRNNKFTDWIVRQWLTDKVLWEDAYKLKDLLEEFDKHRKTLEIKDINGFKDYRDLEDALKPHIGKASAGVRVKNFMDKDQTKSLMKKTAPDPESDDIKVAYKKRQEESTDVPQWFYDAEVENVTHILDNETDFEIFYDEAESYLDPDEFTDEDGNRDEEAWDLALTDYAEDLRQQYIRSKLENEISELWQEYREKQDDEFNRELKYAPQVPELVPFYTTDRLAVLIPNTEEAACYVGSGTQWCTAATNAENYFWEYRLDGPIYVVLTDKLGKYQFHFESAQYMDEKDRPIGNTGVLQKLVSNYPELQEAFKEKAKQFYELWLMPVGEITEGMWATLFQAGLNYENAIAQVVAGRDDEYDWNPSDTTELIARAYVVHKDRMPDKWVGRYKDYLLNSAKNKAFENGWLEKDELDNNALNSMMRNFQNESRNNKEEFIKWLVTNKVDINRETWAYLVRMLPNTLMFIPNEFITPDMVARALSANVEGSRSIPGVYQGKSKIPLFNLLHEYKSARDTTTQNPFKQTYIDNGKKIISIVNEQQIKEAINGEDALGFLHLMQDHFGDFPWAYAIERSPRDSRELAVIAQQLAFYLNPMFNSGIKTKLNRDQLINAIISKRPDTIQVLSKFIETPNALHGFHERVKEAVLNADNWRRGEAILNEVSDWITKDLHDELWAHLRQQRDNEVNIELAKKRAYADSAGNQPER